MLRMVFATSLLVSAALSASAQDGTPASAVFAGGCFWCIEEAFDAVPGVVATTSGYTGGSLENPTYQDVLTETTGHYEAVKVDFDPSKVTYEDLLKTYWRNVDPFDARGQFCDKGPSYRSAIFVAGPEQEQLAEASKQAVDAGFEEPIATEILPAAEFYPAEDYHQNYHETNSAKYKFYKWNCGRAQRLEDIWGKPTG